MTKYITCPKTAKFIRADLKKNFPNTKFSVRSHTYAGGASIRIGWTDGDSLKSVENIANRYESSGFDGMIDYQYSKTHWLLPDGTVTLAYREDTFESRGTVHGIKTDCPDPDAQPIRFGSDYVFCERKLSAEAKKSVLPFIEKKWGLDKPVEFDENGNLTENWHHENAGTFISELIHRECLNRSFPLQAEEGA